MAISGNDWTILLLMRRTSMQKAVCALAIFVGGAVVFDLTGSPEALLFLAPGLLIAATLATGRYLGEDLIVGIVTRRILRSGNKTAAPGLAARLSPVWPPRGTRLIAFSLATRPPPGRPILRT